MSGHSRIQSLSCAYVSGPALRIRFPGRAKVARVNPPRLLLGGAVLLKRVVPLRHAGKPVVDACAVPYSTQCNRCNDSGGCQRVFLLNRSRYSSRPSLDYDTQRGRAVSQEASSLTLASMVTLRCVAKVA